MESTSKFEKLFLKALQEDMTAGAGGALGTPAKPVYSPESPTSGDTYAPGDARRPKVLGSVQTRKGSVRKKKKNKKGINFATGEEDNEVKQKFSKKYADEVKKEFAKHVRLRSPDGKLGVKLPPGNKKEIEDYKKKGYKEEEAEDRCKRKADSVYGKKTSAYKSGAIVRCRRGKIWKKKK